MLGKSKNIFIVIFVFILQNLGCSKDLKNDDVTDENEIYFTLIGTEPNSCEFYYDFQDDYDDIKIFWSTNENVDSSNFQFYNDLTLLEGNYTIFNLEPGKEYFFKISGKKNGITFYSNEIKVNTPSIPINLISSSAIEIDFPSNGEIDLVNAVKSDDHYFLITRILYENSNETTHEIVKTDLNGNKVWQFSVNESPNADEVLPFIHKLSDGNFMIIGGGFIPPNMERKSYVIKFSANGNVIWKKYYPVYDFGVFLGSVFNGKNVKFSFIKDEYTIDINGEVIEHKQLELPTNTLYKLHYNTSGDIINYGIREVGDYGLITYDALIEKYNSSFEVQWTKTYGAYRKDDFFEEIKESSSYDYLFIGRYGRSFLPGADDESRWILKINSIGELVWEYKESSTNFRYYGKDIVLSENGDITVLFLDMYSLSYNVCTVIKLNSDGLVFWKWQDGEEFNTENFQGVKIYETDQEEYTIIGENYNQNKIWMKKIKEDQN